MKRIFVAWAKMASFLLVTLPNSSEATSFKIRNLTPEQKHLIYKYVEEAAVKEHLEPALLRAIIRVESAYDFKAVSRVGARGLMQIMPATAYALGKQRALDFRNPRQNILAGARLLRRLIQRFRGSLALALAAYNAGPTAVKKYKGIPPYPETKEYVQKVLRTLQVERLQSVSN